MVEFSKIFKQAYRITLQNKFLWIFGLFLICGQLLFAWLNTTDANFNFQNFWVLAFFAAAMLMFILYFRSKSAVIIAIKAVIEKQEIDTTRAFKFSRMFYSRILAIYFMLELGMIVLGFVIGSPIEYLFVHHYTDRAVVLSVLGGLILVPVVVLILLMNVLAPLFVGIFDMMIRESLEQAFELISRYWFKLSVLGLLLLLVELPALFLGVFVLGLRGGWGIIIGGTILFLLLESVISVFQQAAWITVFLNLIRPEKLEEEEPEIVPEVAS